MRHYWSRLKFVKGVIPADYVIEPIFVPINKAPEARYQNRIKTSVGVGIMMLTHAYKRGFIYGAIRFVVGSAKYVKRHVAHWQLEMMCGIKNRM